MKIQNKLQMKLNAIIFPSLYQDQDKDKAEDRLQIILNAPPLPLYLAPAALIYRVFAGFPLLTTST